MFDVFKAIFPGCTINSKLWDIWKRNNTLKHGKNKNKKDDIIADLQVINTLHNC